MPKLGMEPIRKNALTKATIREIGKVGTIDVTVAQIARAANMSPALAHHYFPTKVEMLLAAMRQVLHTYAQHILRETKRANSPRARISAIIDVSFHSDQFCRENVAVWLAFFTMAQTNDQAARMLRIYTARLRSNLRFELCQLLERPEAEQIAEGAAAMIDGIYIKQAVAVKNTDPLKASALLEDYFDTHLKSSADFLIARN